MLKIKKRQGCTSVDATKFYLQPILLLYFAIHFNAVKPFTVWPSICLNYVDCPDGKYIISFFDEKMFYQYCNLTI